MPDIHGSELTTGDHLGLDATPDCCEAEMTPKDTRLGYRDYKCGDCSAVLTVAPTGLVFDIR